MHKLIPQKNQSGLMPWGHPAGFPRLPMRPGRLKGVSTTLNAKNDLDAIEAWLAGYDQFSRHTQDAYRREVERFLLWCAKNNISLTELTEEDFHAYRSFLGNIRPESEWISGRRVKRDSIEWRPFTKQPSEPSIQYHWTIISTLMGYLSKRNWVRENPMPAKMKFTRKQNNPRVRSLNKNQMKAMYSFLAEQQENAQTQRETMSSKRDRWVVSLTYYLALREHEVAGHFMNAFVEDRSRRPFAWNMRVRGKGASIDTLPATASLMDELIMFRVAVGLPPYPQNSETVPLVPDIRFIKDKGGTEGIGITLTSTTVTRMTVYRIIKRVMSGASRKLLELGHTEDALQMRRASPHWLRHTRLKDIADATNDLRLTQRMGRHTDIQTSMTYIENDMQELLSALDKIDNAPPRR